MKSDTRRLAVCYEYSELNQVVVMLVDGEGSKLVATGLLVNHGWETLGCVSEPGSSGSCGMI